MQDIVVRLQEIMKDESLTAASFADRLGIGRPILSHVLGGRNNPSLQLVLKILEHFPAYSADWLLLGNASSQTSESEINPLETTPFEPNIAPVQPKTDMDPALIEVKEPKQPSTLLENSTHVFNQVMVLYPDKTFDVYKQR